jgi:Domain of unknown function (DUF4407)
MSRIGDFLAWLGGADRDLLAKVPQERSRFVQMALVLFTTASIAMVSMIFAMNDGVHVPLFAAILTGVFWGFVIFNLDRYLVLSMGHVRTWQRMLAMAIPRFLLAAVISLVIATPLTLRIFQHDIQVQVSKTQAAESASMSKLDAQSEPAQAVAKAKAAIAADDAIIAGHDPNPPTDSAYTDDLATVNKLQPQVANAKKEEINAYEDWQCELYGDGSACGGASNKPGPGPIAQAKQQTYEQDLSTYNTLNKQLQSAQAALTKDEKGLRTLQGASLVKAQAKAKTDLATQEKNLATATAALNAEQSGAQSAVTNDNGILAQLSALSAAGAANPILQFAQWVVTALFFLIEILPVTVKLLLNLAPPTAYDLVAEKQAKIVVDQADRDRLVARRDAERKADEEGQLNDGKSRARINVANDMRVREEALGVQANEQAAKHMQTIVETQLTQWGQQVQEQLNGLTSRAGWAMNGSANGHGSFVDYQPPQNGSGAYGNSGTTSFGMQPPTVTTSAYHGNGNGAAPDDQADPPDQTGFGLGPDGGVL